MKSYRPLSIIPKGYEEKLHIHDRANEKWINRLSIDLQKIPNLMMPSFAPVEFLDTIAYSTNNDVYFINKYD